MERVFKCSVDNYWLIAQLIFKTQQTVIPHSLWQLKINFKAKKVFAGKFVNESFNYFNNEMKKKKKKSWK